MLVLTLINPMSNSNRSLSNKKANNGNQSVEITTAFQGPLPSPEVLDGFEKVLPGSAERIMCMAEKEQEARHKTEKKLSTSGIIIMFTGVIFAFLSIIIIGLLIYFAITKGETSVAIALSTTSLIGVASVFVWFRKEKQKMS